MSTILTFAVLDRDQTPESRAYLEELRGSRYFVEKPPLADYAELETPAAERRGQAAIEIPPGFGRDIRRGRPAEVGAWVDGAMPFRAETIRGYLEACTSISRRSGGARPPRRRAAPPAVSRLRFQLQPGFRQHLRHGAGDHALLLVLIPGHPDGARDRAREGARLDHQSLCHAGDAARVPARQAAALHRRRHDRISP